MYMSVSAVAEKFHISKRSVQLLCEQGRMEGAYMISGEWLIPSAARKPADARKKQFVPSNELSMFEEYKDQDTERISLNQVCEMLSISAATAKNWIRLGKLTVCEDGKNFDKAYIGKLVSEIKSGKDTRLKSRRNKKAVSGSVIYKDYVENENNRNIVRNILEECSQISEEELRVMIAFFAAQLYCQSREIATPPIAFSQITTMSDDCTFNALISDLIGGIDLDRFDDSNIQFIVKLNIDFIPCRRYIGIYLYIVTGFKSAQTDWRLLYAGSYSEKTYR